MIGSQTSWTSSASGPTNPSARCAIAEMSAAKSRLSNAVTRFGGVMARAMKWMALRSGTMPALAKASHGPWRGHDRPGTRSTEHQPGLLVGFTHRRQCVACCLDGTRPFHARHQTPDMAFVQRSGGGHLAIGRLDAAAGENEFPGHELVALVAAAEQHLRHRLAAVDEDKGGGVPRLDVRKRLIAIVRVSRSTLSPELPPAIGGSPLRSSLIPLLSYASAGDGAFRRDDISAGRAGAVQSFDAPCRHGAQA